MTTNLHGVSPDEVLIDFLIENPCLWDKSDHDFRNRNMKDFKWKEVANRMNMAGKWLFNEFNGKKLHIFLM